MNDRLADYNVIWNSPSQNESGSMPLGNGDLAANLWVEPNGDVLLLLAKSDAWDENSINLKLGRVRLKLTPNPFAQDTTFRQSLLLPTAEIEIIAGPVRIRIWVDANEPVIRIETNADHPIELQAQLETWRHTPRAIKTQTSDMFKNLVGKNSDPFPTVISPDRILNPSPSTLMWCHHNEQLAHDPYEINMKLQGLDEMIAHIPHPLLHRTFGAAIEGDGFRRIDDKILKSAEPALNHHLRIHALTLHPSTIEQWQKTIEANINRLRRVDAVLARRNHEKWWSEFWNRSWIYVTADSPTESEVAFHITQSYILQRFMNAAAGRGVSPIKHNGSLFTVGSPDDPDSRRWGGPGFWFQNQRLIYWPMLAAGDFDLMLPWFKMYANTLPLQQLRTRKYFQHTGAHFPETITFWGAEVSGHYGWTPFDQRTHPEAECAYLTYYWSGGIELTLMMLEYFAHTQDKEFAQNILMPVAKSVVEFFDLHYPRDSSGKIRFHPAQALETWHQATNPMPEIAGLNYTIVKLLDLLPDLTPPEQRQWERMFKELPPIPIGKKEGAAVLLPAEQFDIKKNTENPELYAIFPYRLFSLGKENLQLAKNTFAIRLNQSAECWSQDDIQMALLGLTDQAKEWIIRRASPESHSQSRFPTFWNAFHDWIPDIDHGGVLQMALQLMLMQCEDNQITLLPAWPKEWNADFKLHASNNTVVQAQFQNGKITDLKTFPSDAVTRIKTLSNTKNND